MLLHCNMVEWSNDTIIPLYYRKPLQHPQRTITQHSAGRINIIKWFNRFCEAHQTEALSLAQCNVLPRCGSTDQQHQTPRRQASYSCQDSLILTYMSIGYHTSCHWDPQQEAQHVDDVSNRIEKNCIIGWEFRHPSHHQLSSRTQWSPSHPCTHISSFDALRI